MYLLYFFIAGEAAKKWYVHLFSFFFCHLCFICFFIIFSRISRSTPLWARRRRRIEQLLCGFVFLSLSPETIPHVSQKGATRGHRHLARWTARGRESPGRRSGPDQPARSFSLAAVVPGSSTTPVFVFLWLLTSLAFGYQRTHTSLPVFSPSQ